MRGLAISTAVLLLAAAGGASAGSAPRTSLTVTYWNTGTASADRTTWTLTCGPAGGTLKRPAHACSRLASGGRQLFAPTPKAAVCTEIYGGPQLAIVSGTLTGRRLWARFQRRNGCEIDRWNRLSPWLLPPGGVT